MSVTGRLRTNKTVATVNMNMFINAARIGITVLNVIVKFVLIATISVNVFFFQARTSRSMLMFIKTASRRNYICIP
ncbi:MAG: hypothetical protein IKZ28_06560, partial [Clostridia bacterium]|nr:hypothetical protein [Clostridia bacterium]